MRIDELLALPTTVDIPTAAAALGIGTTLAYDLALRREFPVPVLKIGSRYRVPTCHLLELLGADPVAATLGARQDAAS
jgi:hypothetical protein